MLGGYLVINPRILFAVENPERLKNNYGAQNDTINLEPNVSSGIIAKKHTSIMIVTLS